MYLKLFRSSDITVQPFKIISTDEKQKKLYDLGGAYRDAMSSIILELVTVKKDQHDNEI